MRFFFPLMEPVGVGKWRWQLLMTVTMGHFMFVIAFCHLQRVLRILVKARGNLTVTIIVEQITR